MKNNIFNIPVLDENHWISVICFFVAILLHGLIFAFFMYFLLPNMELMRENAGVLIDLELQNDSDKSAVKDRDRQPDNKAETVSHSEAEARHLPEKPPASKVKAESKKLQPQKIKKSAKNQENSVSSEGKISSREDSKSSLLQKEKESPVPMGGENSPHPAYPELARKRGQEGRVHVRCRVNASGKVIEAIIDKSSGYKLLDEAALKSVRKWLFKPAVKNGAKVEGTVIIPVQFRLE